MVKGGCLSANSAASEIPEDIAAAIRKSLKYSFYDRRINKEYYATLAHLSRLDQPSRFINSLRLLKLIPIVDTLLKGGVLLGLAVLGSAFHWKGAPVFFAYFIFLICFCETHFFFFFLV